jgi:DNA repair exonuclease SbcCD ATPase subunit
VPPSDDELAELRRLVALADRALRTDNQADLDKALAGLRALARSTDPETRRLADQAHDAANNANMAQGIADLAKLAEDLRPLVHVFDGAAAIAAQGKENLSFPKAAGKLEEAFQKVVKLKEDVEALKQVVKEEAQKAGAALDKELKDIPDALEKLEATLEKLRDKVRGTKG